MCLFIIIITIITIITVFAFCSKQIKQLLFFAFSLSSPKNSIFRLDNQQELSAVPSIYDEDGQLLLARTIDTDAAWPKHVLKRFVNVLSTHVIQMDLDTAETSE